MSECVSECECAVNIVMRLLSSVRERKGEREERRTSVKVEEVIVTALLNGCGEGGECTIEITL